MVKVRWKLSEVVVSQDGGGGSDPLPVVKFQSTVLSVGEEYSATTGLLVGVTATLDKLWGETVNVPYTLTGDATYLADYWLGKDENDATEQGLALQGGGYGGLFRIQGALTATQWFWVVDDDGPGAPIDEDFILTMQESITLASGTVVSLTNGELATTDTVATVTIIDDDAGGDPTVSWEIANLSGPERDSSSTDYTVNLVLSSAKAGAAVDVSIDGASTATVGPGGVGDDVNVLAAPTQYTFGGNVTRGVPFTVYGDTDVEADETLILTLSNPVNCVLGAITTFTFTIVNDDSGAHETATVYLSPSNPTVVAEGSQVGMQVLYGGTEGHDPFTCTFAVVGQPNGPTKPDGENAAGPDDYTVQTTSPLFFDTNDLSKSVIIQATPTDGVEGNEDFRIALVLLADAGGGTAVDDGDITLGLGGAEPTSQNVTILDGDQGGGEGVDGDLNDWQGNPLIPERRTFDAMQPHFRVTHKDDTDHPFAVEAFQVNWDGIPNPAGGTYANGEWYAIGGALSAVNTVAKLAEYVWRDLHDGTYANPDDVPVGTELSEILVEIRTRSWNSTKLSDWDNDFNQPYVYDNSEGGGYFPHTIFSGPSSDLGRGIHWTAITPSNETVRDIIFYGDGVTRKALDCPNIPAWYLRNGSIMIDNIRFERLGLIGPRAATNKQSGGDIGTSQAGSRVRYHGRLKLYDCQMFAGAWGSDSQTETGWGGRETSGADPKWMVRTQPVSLEARHPEVPLPWAAFWPAWEHYTYVDSPPGPDTYPALTFALAYVNIVVPARNHPTHPDGDQFGGPYFAAQNTLLQITNRAMYNRDIVTDDFGKASSGDVVFIRVDTSEHGCQWSNPGEAIKIGGHNGRVYFKDCRANGGSVPGFEGLQGAPFNLLIENYTVSGSSKTALGPDGAYVIDYSDADATDAGRLYTQQGLVVDGYDVSGDSGGKPFMSLIGVRTVKLRKFRFHNLQGGRSQFTINYMPGSSGISSAGHIRYWDTADLVEQNTDGSDGAAYAGAFSSYPGWGAQTKVTDFFFRHWVDTRGGDFTSYSKTLTSGDVDNMPTDGPAGYAQTNGLIKQQWDGWLTSTSPLIDGGAGSPTWTSVYAGDGDPPLGEMDFTEARIWMGEDDANGSGETYGQLRVIQPGGGLTTSGLKLRVQGTVDVSAIPTATVEYSNQDPCEVPANDAPQTWSAITGTFSFDWYPVRGLEITSDQASYTRSDAWLSAQDPQVWKEGQVTFRVRPNPAGPLSSGTKTLLLDLLDGANRPAWETPYGSATFTQAVWTGGSGELRIEVIPEADYAENGFTSASRTVDPTAIQNGAQFPVQLERRSAGNQDAMRLDGYSVLIGGGSVPASAYTISTVSPPWNGVNNGTTTSQLQSVTVTITDVTQIGDGDTLTLTLQYVDSAQHVVTDTQSDLFQTYTFTFETATPVVEWSGPTNESVDEGGQTDFLLISSDVPDGGNTNVQVALTGTAVYGIDYVTIPAAPSGTADVFWDGASTEATLTLVHTPDVDGDKTVVMQIVDGGAFTIGTKDTKAVTINDLAPSDWPDDSTTGWTWGPIGVPFDQRSAGFYSSGDLSAPPPGEVSGGTWTIPAGTSTYDLIEWSGLIKIPSDGTTTVTFRNCYFPRGASSSSASVIQRTGGGSWGFLTVEYCEFDLDLTSQAGGSGEVCNHGQDQLWHRCSFKNTPRDILSCSYTSTVTDCYFYRWEYLAPSGAHGDAIQSGASCDGVTVTGCNFEAPWGVDGVTANGCIQSNNDQGQCLNWTLEGNRFYGANICVRVVNTGSGESFSGHVIRNNTFVFGASNPSTPVANLGTPHDSICGNVWEAPSDPTYDGELIQGSDPQGFSQDNGGVCP